MVGELVEADRLEVTVNGVQMLLEDRSLRHHAGTGGIYSAVYSFYEAWWNLGDRGEMPLRHGANEVAVRLASRAEGLLTPVVVEDVEVLVECCGQVVCSNHKL